MSTMMTLNYGVELETVGLERRALADAVRSVVGGSVSSDGYGRRGASYSVTDDTGQLTQLWVFVGPDIDPLEQQQQAANWYPHPNYDGTGYYDIALVELSRSFRDIPLMPVNKSELRDRDIELESLGDA